MQTIKNNSCTEKHEDDMDVIEEPGGEDFSEEDCEDIKSKLIGIPLFIVKLNSKPNEEVVECLADKRIRAYKQTCI